MKFPLCALWGNNESRRYIINFGKEKKAVTPKGGFSRPMFV
jgi:hypothetical protein